MASEAELLALAERVEAAVYETDVRNLWSLEREVHAAFGRTLEYGNKDVPPSYVNSWDVAIEIVPEGWEWTVNNYDGKTTDYDGKPDDARPYRCCMGSIIEVDSKNGPAAITAAALRARAATMGGSDDRS